MYSCVKKRGYEDSNYQVIKSNFVTNTNYEVYEVKNPELVSRFSHDGSGKKTPPTPPPKPVRSSSRISRVQSP
jgi:hypothetical protein